MKGKIRDEKLEQVLFGLKSHLCQSNGTTSKNSSANHIGKDLKKVKTDKRNQDLLIVSGTTTGY